MGISKQDQKVLYEAGRLRMMKAAKKGLAKHIMAQSKGKASQCVFVIAMVKDGCKPWVAISSPEKIKGDIKKMKTAAGISVMGITDVTSGLVTVTTDNEIFFDLQKLPSVTNVGSFSQNVTQIQNSLKDAGKESGMGILKKVTVRAKYRPEGSCLLYTSDAADDP